MKSWYSEYFVLLEVVLEEEWKVENTLEKKNHQRKIPVKINFSQNIFMQKKKNQRFILVCTAENYGRENYKILPPTNLETDKYPLFSWLIQYKQC